MKNLLTILSILVVFASCSDRAGGWHSAPELQAAHELMQERPDSALKVLVGFDFGDSTSRSTTNEYQILVAEALYKNDYQQTNAQAVIDATAYYDSVFEKYPENSGLAFETARAHYYKAVGETEDDDIVAACADYLKAADIMEAAFPEIAKAARKGMMSDDDYEKTRFVGLIYNRIGDLMFAEYYHEQAADNYKTALDYAKCISNTTMVTVLLRDIGTSYYLGDLPDSAMFYYRRALDAGDGYENLKCSINITRASIYYEKGLADSAYSLLKMNMLSPDSSTSTQTYYTMGRILYMDKNYDSAAFYLKPCFEHGNKFMRLSSAQMLAEIYGLAGSNDSAAFYNKFVSDNAIKEINRNVKTKSLIDLYDNNRTERHRQKVKHQVLSYSLIAAFIAAALLVALCVIHRRQKKRLAHDANWHLSVANGKLESARRKLSEQQDTIRTKDREIETMRRSTASQKAEERLRSFRASDICATVMSRINELDAREIKLTELEPLTSSELSELRRAADNCLNKFTGRITGKYPKLNIDDLNYLCLCLLGVPNSAMPMLLGKSRSTVWDRAKKIASIMDIKPNETIVQVLATMI
ncbi:MAG: hypothetical protein MJZ90_01685 [Bacteroidales bacterium]|nr:hypothetical protein [Bacteroidales bacterium]